MRLDAYKSRCTKKQTVIVSKDKGASSEHRAHNRSSSDVRHYRLDGDIVKNQSCCDFLLLNDTKKDAYLIELKGRDITKGVKQLEAGYSLFSRALINYTIYYRLIYTKARTHSVEGNDFRKFKNKHRDHFRYKENIIEEDI